MREPAGWPQAIPTDQRNWFANNTIRVRLPKIIREVQEGNPDFTPDIQAALDRLHDDLQNDAPIPMIEMPAPDYEQWEQAYADHAGETWQQSQWFFGETYFYRLLIEIVRWYETQRDPFTYIKQMELNNPALWDMLNKVLATRGQPAEDRLPALLTAVLWGNRIDLSYAASLAHGTSSTDEDLMVGDQEAVTEHLLRKRGTVHFIHDNTGTELAMDLALADALLEGIADQVILHLKMHPTFVSDATLHDLHHFLRLIESGQHGSEARALGQRLTAAFNAKRLRFAPDFYWNSSRFLWEMPAHLRATFEGSTLAIFKGDANYRRVVGDALWPADTPLRHVIGDFPAPVMLLRTMKSDPVVGLPTGMAEKLDTIDEKWRYNGRRGVAQAALW